MRPALRWALALAACAALGVSLLPDEEATVVVAASVRSVGNASAVPVPPRAVPQPAEPVTAQPDTGARTGWPALTPAARNAWQPRPAPPPPVAAAPASAPPPPPPAFPYQWIGQLEEDGVLRIFIAGPQRLWAVTPGEVLDTRWRVEGIQAGQLKLTWLATGSAITLAARP